jgi:hypothetical protein
VDQRTGIVEENPNLGSRQGGSGVNTTVTSENGRQSQGWIVNHEENDAERRLPPPGRVTRQHDVYTSSQVEGLGVVGGGAIADAVGRNGCVDKSIQASRSGRDAWMTRHDKKHQQLTDGACSTVKNNSNRVLTPDPQRHACSKTRSMPPRRHPSPPPFLTTPSIVHRWTSSLEGADHCKNKPRTNMRPKTNVRVETTRYTSSRSLQNPGESNDSPLLKKPRRLIGNGLKQVKRDLGSWMHPEYEVIEQ